MKELERAVEQFLKERKWDRLKPADLAKSISIESAELLELFQWTHDDLEAVKGNKDLLEDVKKELGDVFIYGLEMAALLGLDAEEIIRNKLGRVAEKYPVALVKNNSAMYYKLKKEHRRKEA